MAFAIQTLTLTPYGVSVFTDTVRRKSFVTLFFRHEKAVREVALAFPGLVLDALTRAGLSAERGLDVHLTPLAETSRFRSEGAPRFRCHVEVVVLPTLGTEADLLAFAEELTRKAVS